MIVVEPAKIDANEHGCVYVRIGEGAVYIEPDDAMRLGGALFKAAAMANEQNGTRRSKIATLCQSARAVLRTRLAWRIDPECSNRAREAE